MASRAGKAQTIVTHARSVARIVVRAGLLILLTFSMSGPAVAAEVALLVEAPRILEPTAARIRAMDLSRLTDALADAGLDPPREARIALLTESHPHARAVAPWVVAQALGERDIVIFPSRVGRYPHDSLESVVWHEVVHLALTSRAGGRPLPRWFHEGVAMSVEGWGAGGRARLLAATFRSPTLTDIDRLFASDSAPQTATAYLLAAAIVTDMRRDIGDAVPGAIAARVARGAPFAMAFAAETGMTPADAAARTWMAYRRWAAWVPMLTSGWAVWYGILLLAFAAFVAQVRRRILQRRAWDEDGLRPEEPTQADDDQ